MFNVEKVDDPTLLAWDKGLRQGRGAITVQYPFPHNYDILDIPSTNSMRIQYNFCFADEAGAFWGGSKFLARQIVCYWATHHKAHNWNYDVEFLAKELALLDLGVFSKVMYRLRNWNRVVVHCEQRRRRFLLPLSHGNDIELKKLLLETILRPYSVHSWALCCSNMKMSWWQHCRKAQIIVIKRGSVSRDGVDAVGKVAYDVLGNLRQLTTGFTEK